MLKYSLVTTPIDNGKPYWNSIQCDIMLEGEKIGSYIRQYHGLAKETFCPFQFNGKDYALYSANYTKISLMSLPDCKDIPLNEECVKQMANFCPTSIYVPMFTYDDKYQYWLNDISNMDEGEKLGFSSLAFATGCVWGDDSSDKLMLIDLRNIEQGEMWYVNNEGARKWLYQEFPDTASLKDMEIFFDDDNFGHFPTGYKQHIQKYIHFNDSFVSVNLTEEEIEYELEVHDCGQNPDCTRYRSCDNNPRPIPSEAKLEQLKVIFRKQLEARGFNDKFIEDYIKEKWYENK